MPTVYVRHYVEKEIPLKGLMTPFPHTVFLFLFRLGTFSDLLLKETLSQPARPAIRRPPPVSFVGREGGGGGWGGGGGALRLL
jgi:hypothetical protein